MAWRDSDDVYSSRQRLVRLGCRCLAASAALAILGGCGLFNRSPTPQQQFINALNANQGARASQIWLSMSAEDRAKLNRGEGVGGPASQQAVKETLRKQQQERLGTAAAPSDGELERPTPPASFPEQLKNVPQ